MKLIVALLTCLLFYAGMALAQGGFEVRGKSNAPLESDTSGFEVGLLDTQTDNFLVNANVVVPKDFKATGASLSLVDESGKKIAEIETFGRDALNKKPETWYEFTVERSLLKNSKFVVFRMTEENGLEYANFILGTFGIRDMPQRAESKFPPRIWVPLAEFGLFKKYIGTDEFTETGDVPLDEGQQFGFRIYIRGDGRSVPMKIEDIAPTAPKTWGKPSEHVKISPDGRMSTWEGLVPTEKLVEMFHEIAEGDPEGNYETRVYVRDQLVKTFNYTVKKPPEN